MLFGFHAKTKNRTNECRRKGMEETEKKRERGRVCVCERRREGEKRKEKDKQKKRQHSIIYAKGCDVMMLIMIPHSAQGRRGKEGRGV
jgi:hypothetical protein